MPDPFSRPPISSFSTTPTLDPDGSNALAIHVSVVGSGYVGTTIAACFADMGHEVVTIDVDESIVAGINQRTTPIHEPGLNDLVARHGGDRLTATTDYDAALSTDVTFLALPTPATDDGSIDTSVIETGTWALGDARRDNRRAHSHREYRDPDHDPGATRTRTARTTASIEPR